MRPSLLVLVVAIAAAAAASPASAVTIAEYPIPPNQTFPNSMVTGSDGGLWTTVAGRFDGRDDEGGLLRFDVRAKTFRAVALGGSANSLSNLADGRFIFNLGSRPSTLTLYDPRTGARTDTVKTDFGFPGLLPFVGGFVWADTSYRPSPTEPETGVLTLFNPETGQEVARHEFPGNRFPSSKALSANGDLYFVLDEPSQRRLMRRVLATGELQEVGQVSAGSLGVFNGVTLRDGRIVMVVSNNLILVVDPAVNTVVEVPVPPGPGTVREPVVGPDGAVWFPYGIAIGRLDPASLRIDSYGTPTAQKKNIGGVAVGPDRALWFTETEDGNLGRIDLGGGTTSTGNLVTAREAGLGTTVTCAAACTAQLAATEVRTGSSSRAATMVRSAATRPAKALAKGRVVLPAAGNQVARLRFTAAARRKLKARKLVRLRITQRTRIGGRTVVRRSTVLLRTVKPKVAG